MNCLRRQYIIIYEHVLMTDCEAMFTLSEGGYWGLHHSGRYWTALKSYLKQQLRLGIDTFLYF